MTVSRCVSFYQSSADTGDSPEQSTNLRRHSQPDGMNQGDRTWRAWHGWLRRTRSAVRRAYCPRVPQRSARYA
ncbi:hypothetical protein BVI434_4110001 [Burkholderia vietnamiensis]|nr:hypothetical protein BVI434_4110001 [Burkholderia vietnamiensis]